MSDKLYEYAILFHPKTRKTKEGEEPEAPRSKILTDLQRVLARDDKTVAILAARAIPEEFVDKLEQVEIVVRPF
jgi:hypothetical protein